VAQHKAAREGFECDENESDASVIYSVEGL
jgi:hypothetical protein